MTDFQREFKKRQAQLRKDPTIRALERKLLGIGGTKVCIQNEPHAKLLLERGLVWRKKVVLHEMEPSHCHGNTAELWVNHRHDGLLFLDPPEEDAGFRIVTGWVLGKGRDDVWLQHSWGFDPIANRIIETTVCRKVYFGVALEGVEAAKFYLNNADSAATVFSLVKQVQEAAERGS